MDLYAVAESIEALPLASAIRDSLYLFPVIEAVHLLALALLGGSALMLDLRLLGLGVRSQPTSALERNIRPWLWLAVVGLLVTGIPLALSEAVKLHDKPVFWIKMSALAAATLFTFLVRNPLARRDPPVGVATAGVALVSLALWLTTAISGRWIGFS